MAVANEETAPAPAFHTCYRRGMRDVPFFQILSAIFTIMASNANTKANGDPSDTGGRSPPPPPSIPTSRRTVEFFVVSGPNLTINNRVVPGLAMLSLTPSAAPPASLSSTNSWVYCETGNASGVLTTSKRQTVEAAHPAAWRAFVGRASVPPSLGLARNAHLVVLP